MMAVTANAQIVKGDMNDDGIVDISDVVSTVNVVLGTQPVSYISANDILDPYMVDNSKLVGTWYKTKTETVTFNADYTTNYFDAVSYKYQPNLGRILLYNSSGLPYRKVDVAFPPADTLFLDFVVYTKAKPIYKVTSITLSETSITLKTGNTQYLTATVAPTDADDSSVIWTSSDKSVATINNGLITAVAPGTATITCSANDGSGMAATCTVTVPEPVKVSNITLGETTIVLEPETTKRLTATLLPEDADDKSVSWSSSDENVASVINGLVVAISEGTATITCCANDYSGVSAICIVKVFVDHSDEHVYVDLGLTSGTLWATKNIGANTPEENGNYFAWGETTTQSSNRYYWDSYQYCKGSENTLTKYCSNSSYGYNGFTDNLTDLELEDDAAYINWGSKWRMPTDGQWEELCTECTWSWTSQNNVNGCLVIGPNGNSIFLPAAGYRWAGSLYVDGSYGDYWSRSRYGAIGAYGVFFYDSGYCGWDFNITRANGRSVRPVRK